MQNRVKRWLHRHYIVTFLLAGLAFLIFGMFSLNLVYLLKTNIELFFDHGIMVIEDGALWQLLQLFGYGYISLAFFLLFKACEHILVMRLTEDEPANDNDPQHGVD
jgi:hypothetical protein